MRFGCCISRTEDVKKVREAGYDFFEFAGFAAAKMTESEFDTLCTVSEAENLPCIGFNAYSAKSPVIVGEAFLLMRRENTPRFSAAAANASKYTR